MGTMTKLRDNTGVILWILVIAFGLIWTLQDSGAFETVGQLGNNIAQVNGEPITVEEFNRAVNQRIQQMEQQTGEPLSPQRRDMVREQIFELLVEDRLREQEMDRIGITVTDEEVRQLVYGERPHPFVRRPERQHRDCADRVGRSARRCGSAACPAGPGRSRPAA